LASCAVRPTPLLTPLRLPPLLDSPSQVLTPSSPCCWLALGCQLWRLATCHRAAGCRGASNSHRHRRRHAGAPRRGAKSSRVALVFDFSRCRLQCTQQEWQHPSALCRRARVHGRCYDSFGSWRNGGRCQRQRQEADERGSKRSCSQGACRSHGSITVGCDGRCRCSSSIANHSLAKR
jgi:hypothetical protein